jgi:branched-chain amino acid transport system substrate-binding protein
MTQPTLATLLLATLLALGGAAEAAGPRIGLAAPAEGPFAALGQQMRDGATAVAENADAELVFAGEDCTADGGKAAARQLIAAEVAIVVGFLCVEAIEAAMPAFAAAGLAVITPGVRANGLTDGRARSGWPVWRLAPRADAEGATIAATLTRAWRAEHFAIVDDGTIHGRELAESLRLAAELAGLRPVMVDTYRPQMDNQIGLVGRLARAGATHVFVGGEALRAAGEVPLAVGTLMIAPPEWGERADSALTERLAAAGIVTEGYVLPAYAAVEIAAAALSKAGAEGTAVADILAHTQFRTAIGPVSFDDKGDRAEPAFILHRHDGERFVPVE